MDAGLKKLSDMIKEAERLADTIEKESQGMQVVERNVVRMKAAIKMMKIGVVEPLEM